MSGILKNAAAAVIALSATIGGASAGTLALHSGANDPASEGWGTSGSFSGVTTGAVLNDMGTGIDAWNVTDSGTAGGQLGWYTYSLTAAEVTEASTYGWSLSAKVRVTESPDPGTGQPSIAYDASPFFGYRNGTTSAQVHLGSESDGDPIVHFLEGYSPNTGQTAVGTASATGYHLYEILFDPLSGLVDVSLDGTVVLNALAPFSLAAPMEVLFGAGSSCCVGSGNFAEVKFETFAPSPIPVPASLPLLLGALTGAGWFMRRSKARGQE